MWDALTKLLQKLLPLQSPESLFWCKDSGDFSTAVAQANSMLEDQSQIESGSLSFSDAGPSGTFVGVYDGHGGSETSRFVVDHLFHHLKRFATEQRSISEEVIKSAFRATEEGFQAVVEEQWRVKPQIATVGSCCLVGVISGGNLYIGNAGDSRVVLGRIDRSSGRVIPVQLSVEHNASIESVRKELRSIHPDDPQIVVQRHNVWRVKGVIQVSRSIGDFYLKKAEFNREPLFVKYRLREPIKKPILTAEPATCVRALESSDLFLIFASDGLWEQISNQEAVEIVHRHPRSGSARRLVRAAMQEAARKREMRYSDLKKIDRGIRRHFHDDITVVVVFLESRVVSRASSAGRPVSLSIRNGGQA